MRIPFTLEAWLKDKSQKVETRYGRPVKIICFEMTDTNGCPIAAQFRLCAGTPVVYLFDKEGHYKGEGDSDYDLFIVTPEEEKLTPFEIEVKSWMGIAEDVVIDDSWVKTCAKSLLSLARKQLIKDGYVIEKKAFHDAVKKVDPEVMAEVSEAIDLSNFEYTMLRYVQEGANVKNNEELIELTKKYSKELHKILKPL